MFKKILLVSLVSLFCNSSAFAEDTSSSLKNYPPEVQQVAKDYLNQIHQEVTVKNIEKYIDQDPQGANTFVFMLALRKSSAISYILATEKLNVAGIPYTVSNFKSYLDSTEFKSDLQTVMQGLSPK